MQRVLCIESDGTVRARVRRLLEAEGLSVDESSTGLAGIERALTLPPDLVLADVHLPDIDGAELATRLKQEKSLAEVPFIAFGRFPDEHQVALAAGCDGFIDRDAGEALIREEVLAYLAGKRERVPVEGERAALRMLSASMASRLGQAVTDASRAERLLAERNRLGALFMRNLAHELATPITPIAGYLKILDSEKLGPLGPQQKRVVESIRASVSRLVRIVENLSDFAHLQAGQARLDLGPLDPDALAEEVVAECRTPIREARLHVEVARAGGTPVVGDARKLRQALLNLLGNAIKFSPHGGELLMEVTRDPGHLRFAVYDQGPGVPAADQEHVFEPFFHASGSAEGQRLPGSGLGLPVARAIAAAHGGRVWVESPPHSQPGSAHHYSGSKFVLELPLGAPGAPAEPLPA